MYGSLHLANHVTRNRTNSNQSANNLPSATPLGFEPMTLTLIPLVGPQTLPTLLKAIAIKKGAYPNLIVPSPKHLWHSNMTTIVYCTIFQINISEDGRK